MPADDNIESILERLARKEITPRQAVLLLTRAGFDREFARETVLVTLGGGDLIEIGQDGRERYMDSGRLVSEVQAEMER